MTRRDGIRRKWTAMWRGLCVGLLLGMWGAGCAEKGGPQGDRSTGAGAEAAHEGEKAMQRKTIEQVQEEHTPFLMTIDGVIGTYVGQTEDGQPCIKVMVRRRTKELEARLPDAIEGYPVEIVESGEIRPLPGTSPP